MKDHFDFDSFPKYSNLPDLYIRQLYSSVYMFFIGCSTTLTMCLLEDSKAGKSAEKFLAALFSGLEQLKVFLLTSAFFLFLASIFKLNLIIGKFEQNLKPNFLTKTSVEGLFSFLIPLAFLTFSVVIVSIACLYAYPELALKQEIDLKKILSIFLSGLILLCFPVLFYIASDVIDRTKSIISSTLVTLVFTLLFLIAIFDIAK